MTLDDPQLTTDPVGEQAAYWLQELEDEPTADRYAAFTQWLNTSPDHFIEFVVAQQVAKQLQSFYRARRVDVDAMVERGMQEERSNQRHR